MAILRNLPANIVPEIVVKVQFATHEEWRQNLGNGLLWQIDTRIDQNYCTDIARGCQTSCISNFAIIKLQNVLIYLVQSVAVIPHKKIDRCLTDISQF